MPEAPIYAYEQRRMAAVNKAGLLGTPAEERFDRITRLAQRLFDVPFACLDIVGEKLVWLKSVRGFEGIEGLRKDSYCHYTVLESEYCVINDARKDPRVFDSCLADTWVFYAGVPVKYEGENIGVLCIGDTKPRDFDVDQIIHLCDFAAMAEREFSETALSEPQRVLAMSREELQMKARIDVPTHLWNREAILELAESAKSGADGKTMALLLVGIDQFEQTGDALGPIAADRVLRDAAQRVRAALRPADALGRYGADRFLAVISEARPEEIYQIGERISRSVEKSWVTVEGHRIPMTCSIGGALLRPAEDRPALLGRAELSLSAARAVERRGVVIER